MVITSLNYVKLSFKGYNFTSFINCLKNQQITIYNIKNIDNKTYIFTVNYKHMKKVIAISNELCYNTQIIGYYGLKAFFKKIVNNIGILVGCLLFFSIVYLSSFFVFDIKIIGNGDIYREDILNCLDNYNIDNFTLINSKKINEINKKLKYDCSYLQFISVKKKGYRLIIDTQKVGDVSSLVDKEKRSLISKVDGTLYSLQVYRGMPLKSVGDKIQVGDEIISGNFILNDKNYSTYILYKCEILTEFTYNYICDKDNMEDIAEIFALEQLKDVDIKDVTTAKTKDGNNYIYTVKIKYIVKL